MRGISRAATVLMASTALVGTALVGTALGGTALVGSAEARPAAEPPGQGRTTGPAGTVTLITGDRVTVGGPRRAATVRPGKGRERVHFLQHTEVDGDLNVVPVDVADAVRTGRLDPRLFNVTQLIKHRFDDRSRKDIPLIVSGAGNLRSFGATRDLPSIGATAVRVAKSAAGGSAWTQTLRSQTRSTQRIWLDGPVRASLDKSVPQIGAPTAWQSGLTGKDTKVAVLDTGIDTTHPDLDDAVVDAKDFTESESGTADRFGHGTHVASIVTGDHDTYKGVAPDAKLLNGKVLGDDGGGSESGVIAGMEWAASAGADVINMSLGGGEPTVGDDPISVALNQLTEQTGALFVVSAGNTGGTPGSPATADAALTVGAVDGNDALADFSSRGPRWKDDAIKPDITAPGVGIVAAKAKDSFLGDNAPTVGEHHLRLSGTSMASPHVAGAAAILAQQHPDWKAADLKAALMGTAKPHPTLSVFEQGAGRVDLAKATTTAVRAVPGSLSLGVVQWPHHDDQPITKHLTYHNTSASPVTLPLSADVRDPAGKPAPPGMFTVTPASLTIPAGGTAQATVTADTTITAPDGIYSGVVTGGDIRTPIAINREVESYDVKLTTIGFDGKPAPPAVGSVVNLDYQKGYLPTEGSDGVATFRLPKGRFSIGIIMAKHDGTRVTLASEPTFGVTGPTGLTIDARDGRPAGFVTDQPKAKPARFLAQYFRHTTWTGKNPISGFVWTGHPEEVLVRPSKTAAAPADFELLIQTQMAEPDSQGGFTTSPYLYHLTKSIHGRIPRELLIRVRDQELARVRSFHAATKPGTLGTREEFLTRPLPYALNEFYTPDTGWHGIFTEGTQSENFSVVTDATPQSYRTGRTAIRRWNAAVFGPAFPAYPPEPSRFAGRLGDVMDFALPLFADQAPGRDGYAAATGSTTLFRDGEQIGSKDEPGFGRFGVPAGGGRYRLRTEATREHPLSSRVSAVWTFRSGTVAGETPAALPLLAVRFAPRVDQHNRVAAKAPTVVPIAVEHNAAGTGRVTSLQVSHEGGASWQPAKVVTAGGKSFTVIKHPLGATAVSLKAHAKDAAGNTVEQTVVGAFLLK